MTPEITPDKISDGEKLKVGGLGEGDDRQPDLRPDPGRAAPDSPILPSR